MTAIDKAAIAWTIAIVVVGVAIAGMGDQLQGTSAPAAPTYAPTEMEKESAETMESTISKPTMAGWDRIESAQDPGIGHESHQLAVILAPSDKVYSGSIQYDASEPIQLVTLHGPLAAGEDSGQPIWTPDGKTKFALTLVDQNKARGSWDFAGNALAVHTMNTETFITDYKLDYKEQRVAKNVMNGVVESIIDPGVGHESHSLAVIIPPSEDIHTGILSYSASESIQLVSLNGPLGSDESADLIWTPDGSTIFELTFIDAKTNMGSWKFSGNALALHTLNTNGFTASYSVATEVEHMEKEEVMKEEEPPAMTGPKTVEVSIPSGTSVPGCEETNECYIPATVSINVGDTVSWPNDDTAAHTVTAGSAADGPNGVFDSSLLIAGGTFEYTFDSSGNYDYYCMVHPWMTGSVKVS
jgi:plastocyanin